MEQILVLGHGGHAISLVDILEREKLYNVAGYVVNNDEAEEGWNYPIIGRDEDLEDLYRKGITNAAIGIGYLGKGNLRETLYDMLKKIGYKVPVICDPSAIVSEHATIQEGSFIGKGAIINSGAVIGKGCIINSGAIVEHDCYVNDFSHISVGSVLCGEVQIGSASFIGANATIIQGVVIQRNSIVGAGAVVTENIMEKSIAAGVPAKIIKSNG